jgi:hypothetical protein
MEDINTVSLPPSSEPKSPNKSETKSTPEQSDTCGVHTEVMTPDTGDILHTPVSYDIDSNLLKDGELDELLTKLAERPPPSPPVSPGPVSPIANDEELRIYFSGSYEANNEVTTLKKKSRSGTRKGAGYGGVRKPRKPRGKKKQVQFKDPLCEIRLIDGQTPIKVYVDATATGPTANRETRVSAKRKNKPPSIQLQVQPIRGVKWTGFGTNHIPRHYPAIRDRETKEKAKEAELDKEHNKAYILLLYIRSSVTN